MGLVAENGRLRWSEEGIGIGGTELGDWFVGTLWSLERSNLVVYTTVSKGLGRLFISPRQNRLVAPRESLQSRVFVLEPKLLHGNFAMAELNQHVR